MAKKRATSVPATNAVEKTIYFYLMKPLKDTDSLPALAAVFGHLNAMPFTETGRYYNDKDGRVVCCWPDPSPKQNSARFSIIRRTGLPQKELAGKLSDIALPTGGGLAEQIHMMFFVIGASIIIGSEYNHHGPRVPGFRHYLKAKCSTVCCPVTIEPIIRRSVADQLAKLEDIRLLDLKLSTTDDAVKRSQLEGMTLFDAVRSSANSLNADSVEVVLRPKPFAREATLDHSLFQKLKALWTRKELPEDVKRMVIKGYNSETERVESVDVLRTVMYSTKKIAKENEKGKALDTQSAYAAIEEAYAESAAEIKEMIDGAI